MSVSENKEVVLGVLEALAEGDYESMLEAMTDDVLFYVIGSTTYSGTFSGKRELLDNVLAPMGNLRDESGYSEEILTVIGEGDIVVTESRGRKRTKTGQQYNNEYAFVYRLRDGRICEWRCYLDTQLLADTHK